MKIKSKLFQGIDASLEESLLAYGVLVSIKPNKDNEYCIIYRVTFDKDDIKLYDVSHMSQEELINITQNSWFDKNAFTAYLGTDYNEWIESTSIVQKVSDMLSYYSYQDIFGVSYDPWTLNQTIKYINNYKEEI